MKRSLFKSLIIGFSFVLFSQFSFGQLTVTPASGPNICDGTAAITNPSQVIQSSVVWYGAGNILIASNTYQIGNLCPGSYWVYYSETNSVGVVDTVFASFGIMGGSTPCATFNATLTTTPCSTTNSNDGTIVANVTGGVGPYSYLWSTGTTLASLTNVNPGYSYCVTVNDLQGCILTVCDSMTISAPTTGDTLVVNNANCGPAAIGNFVQQYEDCNFDFNACTSASMTSSTMVGVDTLQTVWTFVDSNNVTIGTYTIYYYIPNGIGNGCVNLQFILYCPIKSSNIKTIVVNDAAQLSGLNELVKNPFTVMNPIGSELTVQFDEVTNGTMRLYNLNGQVVKTQALQSVKQVSIATTNVPAGTYFFQLEVGSTVYTQKVIK